MPKRVKVCDYCHGGGTVTVWDGKKYVTKTCPACGGSGMIDLGTI